MRQLIFLFISLAFLFSCGSKEYLYDKVGFELGEYPNKPDPRINKTAPDYYYRAAPTVPQDYPVQPYYYAPPPAYAYPAQQAYVPAPYQQFPASRYYSDPYAIPASPYNYQVYDADQYYTPPSSYYGGAEIQDRNGNRSAIRY